MQVARTRRGLPTVSTKRKTMNENMDEDETRLVRRVRARRTMNSPDSYEERFLSRRICRKCSLDPTWRE